MRVSRILNQVLAAAVISSMATAQNRPDLPVVGHVSQLQYASQPSTENTTLVSKLVAEKIVRVSGATTLGFTFGDCKLSEGSLLELESLVDGDKAVFDADLIMRTAHTPYFNGDSVRFRLWSAPGASGDHFSVTSASVGTTPPVKVGVTTLCGSDNRSRATYLRTGRLIFRRGTRLFVCTANLISSKNCFASAGHCFDQSATAHVVQFDVPSSTSTGNLVAPAASKQWSAIGTTSTKRFENAGIGRDWSVFLTSVNTTGRHAGPVRGSWFPLTYSAPLPTTNLTIRGCGADNTPRTNNFTLQRASGPHVLSLGSTIRHRVDTEGGVSGAAITYVSGGSTRMIAVHTNGGCNALPVTFNSGTLVSYAPFRTAISTLCNYRADLVVDYVSNSVTSMRRGASYPTSVRIRNAGRNACVGVSTGIYLSTNSTISTGDTLLGSFSSPALNPAQTYIGTRTVRIPTNARLGTCYLGALVDRAGAVSESNEGNNTRSIARICFDYPDLLVESLLASKTALLPSDKIAVTTVVTNKGFSTSGACTTGIYLSTDATITTSDQLIGSQTTGTIKANASQRTSTSVVMPSRLPVGTCYLGAYADRTRAVAETSESNNSRALRVSCLRPAPDFAVTAFSLASSNLIASGLVSARLSLRNSGNVSAPAARHGIYLSTDATISTTDTLLGTYPTSTMAVNQTISTTRTLRLPANLRSGRCYVGVLLDYARLVAEQSETNNVRAVAATCTGRPDFTVTRVTPTTTSTIAGSFISTGVSIQNIGGATAPVTQHALMLARASIVSTSDLMLTRFASPALAANATSSVTMRSIVPGHLTTRSYYIGVISDVDRRVQEASETNNNRTSSTRVTVRTYVGTSRYVHFIPSTTSAATNATNATFALASGAKSAKIAVTAPALSNHLYLGLWSASSSYQQDAFTTFGLGLVNSPLMPNWFGALDATGRATNLSLNLPKSTGFSSFRPYMHVLFITPGFGSIVGISTNNIVQTIRP